MNILTAQEMRDLSDSLNTTVISLWLANPVTQLLYNSILAIPPDSASSPVATASEQALAAMGGQRMKDAILRSIVDPGILSTKPSTDTTLDATYGVKLVKKENTSGN